MWLCFEANTGLVRSSSFVLVDDGQQRLLPVEVTDPIGGPTATQKLFLKWFESHSLIALGLHSSFACPLADLQLALASSSFSGDG